MEPLESQGTRWFSTQGVQAVVSRPWTNEDELTTGVLFLCCFCSFGSWVGICKVSNYLGANVDLFVQHTCSIERLEIICMG